MSFFSCMPDCLLLKCIPKRKYSFPFDEYRAYVEEVIDGDTFHITFIMYGKPMTIKLRLTGVDAPELHSKNKDEIVAGKLVGKYVRDLIEKKYVKCELKKWDKYGGRVVGSLNYKGRDLSCHLIEMGYVKCYEGAKKSEWTNEELNRIIKKMN